MKNGAGVAEGRVDGTGRQHQEEGRESEDEGAEDDVRAAEQQQPGDGHEGHMAQDQRLDNRVDLAGLLLEELAKVVEGLKQGRADSALHSGADDPVEADQQPAEDRGEEDEEHAGDSRKHQRITIPVTTIAMSTPAQVAVPRRKMSDPLITPSK
jgi:hypothetical protein